MAYAYAIFFKHSHSYIQIHVMYVSNDRFKHNHGLLKFLLKESFIVIHHNDLEICLQKE